MIGAFLIVHTEVTPTLFFFQIDPIELIASRSNIGFHIKALYQPAEHIRGLPLVIQVFPIDHASIVHGLGDLFPALLLSFFFQREVFLVVRRIGDDPGL